MNVELGRVSSAVAGASLIGAGVCAITAGWDRWSYCWERGSYACGEAQNDAPYRGVLSAWNAEVLVVSWLLLAVGLLALTVAVWSASRGAVVLLGLGVPGAVGLAVTEVMNPYHYGPSWVLLAEVFFFYLGLGCAAAAALVFVRWDGDRGPWARSWRWVAGGLLLLAAAAPMSEFLVLLVIDGSHDTPTLTGIYRGTLYLLTVGCLAAAVLVQRRARGQRKAPDPAGSRASDVVRRNECPEGDLNPHAR